MSNKPTTVLITGWSGLLGFHARAALTASNSNQLFKGKEALFRILLCPRINHDNEQELAEQLRQADVVLHLAGINRASPDEQENQNKELANVLVKSLVRAKVSPHVIYANSTHENTDTPYGRGKLGAHKILHSWANSVSAPYTNFVIPHVFGENSRPFYNTVTATFCQHVVDGTTPDINPGGNVELIHAGDIIDSMVAAYHEGLTGTQRLAGESIGVCELYNQIVSFKEEYDRGFFPDLQNRMMVRLFNTYRSFEFPASFPRALTVREDVRGTLFEAVKGGGGGQTFLSWTEPGVERGNHFHRHKVERFLVVSGQADIHVRRIFDDRVHTYSVSGEQLEVIDMPTLHTHSIVNTSDQRLLTLFWAHEIFDPGNPDTYAQTVMQNEKITTDVNPINV